ncbi:MAG: hypothetical protein KDI55_10335 [Anaerolineae bacterium]|nr:hypothetical protein [Anaerolineae bacterium]
MKRRQRAAVWGWKQGLAIWMTRLKRPFSAVVARLRPSLPWQPLEFTSLEEYARWLPQHVRWIPDPLGGVVDFFPSLGYAAFQLFSKGVFEDDCDGLAVFSAANVEPFCDRPEDRYLVTVLINPYDMGLANAAHVMLFFKHEGMWRIISNQLLFEQQWQTFLEALTGNPYVGGRPVLWAAVQDLQYRNLWRGRPQQGDSRPAFLQ